MAWALASALGENDLWLTVGLSMRESLSTQEDFANSPTREMVSLTLLYISVNFYLLHLSIMEYNGDTLEA